MADTSDHPAQAHLSESGSDASYDALDKLTSDAGEHHVLPHEHIHRPADAPHSHSWLKKILPNATVDNLENYYHLGNYVYDRHTNERTWEAMSIYVRLGMHLLYYGTYQAKFLAMPSTIARLQAQSEKMGKEYDDPKSKAHIAPFIKTFKLEDSMKEMKEPDPSKYSTFNEFFAREIKPEARPVDDPQDDRVTSSPADCRLTAFPTIDLATKYWVKGYGFSLEKLFQKKEVAQMMDGGSMVIARLAPQDYHRWHAPVSGTVIDSWDIPGAYYTVNPQAINESGTLDVYCENKRSVMLVKRNGTGSTIAIIAVGAMLVGSIRYKDGCEKQGTEIKRGQCLGAFYYGGSTVLVIYPKGEVALDEDLTKRSTGDHPCETLMKVGWSVGRSASA